MQLASVGYTYVTKIFSTNVGKTSSTRFFLMGKPPLGTIYEAYDVTKTNSTILMGKKPLMTYKITPSKNLTCASLSFLNWFVDEKNPKIALRVIHGQLVAT
jgi:hypothetical protein